MPVDIPPAQAVAAASSPDWSVRAEAGRQLAGWADRDDIAALVHDLLLDPDDTAVTEATGRALLHRQDLTGVRLFARAVTAATDLRAVNIRYATHLYHLHDTIAAYLTPDGPVSTFLTTCATLANDADPGIAAGARQLSEWAQPWQHEPDHPDIPTRKIV